MMETVYTDKDFLDVYKQRARILNVFFAVLIAYVAFCVAWLIYYMSLPYADPMQALPQACVYVASGLFVIFVAPYMGIKYHRVNKYYKFLFYVSEGKKYEETCYFVGFARTELQKDNVDVISCIFKKWNKKKSEWMEREVYFDVEKEWPDLEQGDLVHYIAQSNFLIQYDVLERVEVEEDEDEEEGEEVTQESQNETQEAAQEEHQEETQEAAQEGEQA